MVRVNLLPWRQQRRQREQRVFAAQLAASFAAAAFVVALPGFYLGAQIDRQEQRNRLLTDQVARLDGDIAEIAAVRARLEEIDHRIGALAGLWTERSATVEILDELAQTMVPGAHYTDLTRRGDTLAAKGVAASNVRVSGLMRNLRDSYRFSTPSLKSIGAEASEDYGREAATFALTFMVGHGDAPSEDA